ncbi:MAG: hypothetical protein ABS69_01800 [Nitrosomonadales bacterium SCN 54-20]|nr:MAG: hypothetical protein ABS69_01800 [Nitrosomonadales bacterium SCN 54-20]
MRLHYDTIIIGGGLAGLIAAKKLSEGDARALLIDDGLTPSSGRLGGFAEFSGAKFSFLPAGQGLIPLAGSYDALVHHTDSVVAMLGLADRLQDARQDKQVSLGNGFSLRSYESIVLMPNEVRRLLEHLTAQLSTIDIMSTRVVSVQHESDCWTVVTVNGSSWTSRSVLFAGGRTGGDLLIQAGAEPQQGKGLDVGVRIEFADKRGLNGLRSIGPDAKILLDQVRTFCLNSPGHIFRYPFENYTIPGGIVADDSVLSANVGILYRVLEKERILESTKRAILVTENACYADAASSVTTGLGDKLQMTRSAWGASVAEALQNFCERLGKEGLVDWTIDHRVHWPLLDWHWNVFGQPATAETTQPGLFVAGDTAGHARGLLQAAVSGWLAAMEIANAR